jgi:AcrR family transcriptional regulator
MAGPRKAEVSPRKTPKQARSNELVSAILEAAIRVLEREGAQRFTTARVAATAGVSVGSLYQYFPNKGAILFRLQSDEWERTAQQWKSILEDKTKPPPERLRSLVQVFLCSECEEAAVRTALNDAAPLIRDAPDAGLLDESTMEAFMREALPEASSASRRLAADLIEVTLTEVGERFSEQLRAPAEIEAYSGAMADMFCAYIHSLEGEGVV